MRNRRTWSAKEKLAIVVEGLGSEHGIGDVCRRRGITTTQYYTWRQHLLSSAEAVFGRREKDLVGQEERHKTELVRLRAVIAEITAENLELKKTFGD